MRKLAFYVMFAMTIVLCHCLYACVPEIEGNTAITSGTWYLVSYGGDLGTSYTCDWGENMRFSSGKCYWNKRNRGSKNTTYTFSPIESGFYCYNNVESYTFYYTNTGNKRITTYSDDGITRIWKR